MMAFLLAFLDTNVILDILLERQPWFAQAAVLWNTARNRTILCYASASSITDIYYISDQLLRRHPISGLDARQVVRQCLDNLSIVGVNSWDLERAYKIGGKDFEDDLQRVCAESCGSSGAMPADVIVTRDLDGFRGSEIPVYTPEAFVHHLIQTGAIPDPGQPPIAGGPTS